MDSRGSRRRHWAPPHPTPTQRSGRWQSHGTKGPGFGGVPEAGARVYFLSGPTGELLFWPIPKPSPLWSPHGWPGFMRPTGIIPPCGFNPDRDRSQGRPLPIFLLFRGPGERLVPTTLGFTAHS